MENSRKLKVLQIFGSLGMGGAESRMMDVYRTLDKNECEFGFVTLQSDKQYYEDEIVSLGGCIHKLGSPREIGILRHIKELRACMKNGEYDAVHAHTSYHCGLAMLAAWAEHIPVRIAHSRTTGTKQSNPLKMLPILFGRCLINLFATSKLAISVQAGNFLFGKARFEVVKNSINLDKYHSAQKSDIPAIREELGIPQDAFVIGQIGRFDRMKNHTFSVEWFAQYLKNKPESFLVFVGDGPLREAIEEQAAGLGIKERILFTGVRGDVPRIIHSFDILLFPSLFEGLGGVVLEAQAAGIATVKSDTVPDETDLGLGLVKSCSLNDSFSIWNGAVDEAATVAKPEREKICAAFDKKKYSITATTERYLEIYGGK